MNYKCNIYGPDVILNLTITTPDDVDALAAALQSIRTKLSRLQAEDDRNRAITERAESLLGIKTGDVKRKVRTV